MASSKHYFPIRSNGMESCPVCVKQIPINDQNQVTVGDHIILRSTLCDHHLIVVEKHSSDKTSVDVTAVDANVKYSSEKKLISLHRERKTIPLNGKAFVVSYTCPMFNKKDIAQRAVQRYEKNSEGDGEIFEYNIGDRNCECFATWCVTGRYFSFQVWKFLPGRGNSEKLKQMHDGKELCDSCYQRLLQTTLEVPWLNTRPTNLKKGDIVSYFYYCLWHDAVVLEVVSDTTLVLAHFGRDSLLSPIKLMKESVPFPEGSILVVYDYSGWDVYSPDEVVKRAESKIGSQDWNFVHNRSAHFAKWCKVRMPEN